MLIIRTKLVVRPEELEQLRRDVKEQEKTGTVILPAYCEALYIPPDMDVKIKVLGRSEIG